jgi:hypothetical protein
MPIKLFENGEILTAASVNTFFMDQALCVFDTATARDAAFGAEDQPELKEGRICYLKSDKTIYIYTFSGSPEILQWTPQLAEIEDDAVTEDKILDGSVTSAKILDGTIVNGDINSSAAIALTKLGTGALPTSITVASENIVNGTIVDDDIKSDAAITLTKLGAGTLPANITVASANIVNGTIVDEDINSLAAIAQSKISGLSASFTAKLDATATAVNSAKIGGRTVFVQQGTPSGTPAIGDIWFQVSGIAPL